jgi:hypothetical protein
MPETEAKFAIRVDADAEPAKEAAAELAKFQQTIQRSKGAVEDYSKSLRMLRGSSAEVTDAKAKLKAAIEAERGKISQANLGILKLGSSYDKLAKATKKSNVETGASAKAFKAAGGPVADLAERFEGLQGLLPVLATGWGAIAVGVGAAVAAIALAAGAVAALTSKFTEWLATTADANRNLRLQREAFSGSAANADAWQYQMGEAAKAAALTTQELQDLVVGTEKTYRGFRITGQGMVDAFQASAAAAGAGRKDIADFFNELIGRGKNTGRSFLNLGSFSEDMAKFRALGFKTAQDVGQAMGIKIPKGAQGAIVSTSQLAAGLAKLSGSKFADMNQKKMLGLDFQLAHLRDNFMHFTDDLAGEGGALEPLLKGIKQVADLFDVSSDSGKELKATITKYGTAISAAIVAHIPQIKAFVAEVIHLANVFIDAAAAVIQWSQSANGATAIKAVLIAIGVTVGALAVAFGVLAAVVAAPFAILAGAIYGVMKAVDWIRGIKWGEIGTAIVDGIKNGLESAWNGLKAAVSTMGEGIKSEFKKILGIASPSKEFALFGRQSALGYQQGIVRGQPGVRAATSTMADAAVGGVEMAAVIAPTGSTPPVRGGREVSGGVRSGGAQIGTIENHFHIAAGAHAEEVRAAVSSQSFLDQLERSFRAILQSQGLPTTTAPSAGG